MNINAIRHKLALWIYPGEFPNLDVYERVIRQATIAMKQRKCNISIYHAHPDCDICKKGVKREEDNAPQLS